MELVEILTKIGWDCCYGSATGDRHWNGEQVKELFAKMKELDPELVLIDQAWVGSDTIVATASLSSAHALIAGRGTPHINIVPSAIEGANRIGNLLVATNRPGCRVVWDELHSRAMAEIIADPPPERYQLVYGSHYSILRKRWPMHGTHGYKGTVPEASVWWQKPDGQLVKAVTFSGTFAVLEQ